jgi:hypothetical protein
VLGAGETGACARAAMAARHNAAVQIAIGLGARK